MSTNLNLHSYPRVLAYGALHLICVAVEERYPTLDMILVSLSETVQDALVQPIDVVFIMSLMLT
jgi:hypothetical protein